MRSHWRGGGGGVPVWPKGKRSARSASVRKGLLSEAGVSVVSLFVEL